MTEPANDRLPERDDDLGDVLDQEPFKRTTPGYGEGGYYSERSEWEFARPHAGKSPQDYRRSDEKIQEDVSERLALYERLDATEISVEVLNGEVMLSGTVDGRSAKREAEAVAGSVRGVVEVHNHLRIKDTRRVGPDEPETEDRPGNDDV